MFHLAVLNEKRQQLLPLITAASADYYLAGGTALALQIGHRDSIDFDFFIQGNIDTQVLFTQLETIFSNYSIQKTQDEYNTLSCSIDGDIRLSFFGYAYPLIHELVHHNNLSLASIFDIGCMKLSAITSRATLKDYVDLFFILKHHSLEELLRGCTIKYPTLDQGLILKSLVYFDDLLLEPIQFFPGSAVTVAEIQTSLIQTVKEYWNAQ